MATARAQKLAGLEDAELAAILNEETMGLFGPPAMGGIMSVTGYEETGPTKVGFWMCDMSTGLHAAFAIASALLLTPGYITDFLGFSLIIPWTRRFYRGRVTKWYEKRYTTRRANVGGFAGGGFQGDGFRRGPDGVYETTARVEPDGKLSDDR